MRPPNAEEQVIGAALDMRIIAANSPKAKGRVERNYGTHQDPLVKKLRRLQIVEAGAANAFLETTYLPEHNARFAVAPLAAGDFHRRAPSRTALDRIFQLEETRVLSNDWVVQYETRYFQVGPQSRQAPATEHGPRARKRGRGACHYRGRPLAWTELAARPAKATPTPRRDPVHRPHRPSVDHPWRRDTTTEERELALCRAANR